MTRKDDGNLRDGSETRKRSSSGTQHSPHRVRLPGFITDEEIGLGDVVKRRLLILG